MRVELYLMSGNTAVRTSRNTAMLFAGTLTRMLATFAFVLFAAALLGVDGFGKYSLAIHFFELFLSLAATAVGILLTREIAKRRRHLNHLMSSAVVLLILLALTSVGLLPLLCWCLSYSAETTQALRVMSIGLVPASLCVLLEAIFVALERAEFIAMGTVLESALRIALSFAVLLLGFRLMALMWVLVFARVIMLLTYWICLRRVLTPKWEFHGRRFRLFVSRWRVFAAENWLATIYTSLDVIVLSAFAGEVAVGIYSAAWKVVRLGAVVAKSYTTAVFPVLSRMYVESRQMYQQLSRDSIRYMVAIALPIVITVFVLTERIIDLLYIDEYQAAVPVLRVLIWVLLLEFLNPFLSHTLFAQGRQRQSMTVAAISLLINAVATFWFVAKWGAVGAALGTLLGGVVALCCYAAFALQGPALWQLTAAALRIALAAAGLGITLFLIRDYPWLALLVVGGLVYTILLWLVRGVSTADLRAVRNCLEPGTNL